MRVSSVSLLVRRALSTVRQRAKKMENVSRDTVGGRGSPMMEGSYDHTEGDSHLFHQSCWLLSLMLPWAPYS